jgi:hypothetical protein
MLRHVTDNIPNAPAFDTAAANAGQLALPMGAWTMGRATLSREQREVFSMSLRSEIFVGQKHQILIKSLSDPRQN